MKFFTCCVIFIGMLFSCETKPLKDEAASILGTWKLISGVTIEKNDTVTTDYLKGKSFIKIIDSNHFAFLGHDLHKGKDNTVFFSSGGGTYQLRGNEYTEHLEYCNAREWEGNEFHFTIAITKDSLIQKGVEKLDSLGIDRINIETYARVK